MNRPNKPGTWLFDYVSDDRKLARGTHAVDVSDVNDVQLHWMSDASIENTRNWRGPLPPPSECGPPMKRPDGNGFYYATGVTWKWNGEGQLVEIKLFTPPDPEETDPDYADEWEGDMVMVYCDDLEYCTRQSRFTDWRKIPVTGVALFGGEA